VLTKFVVKESSRLGANSNDDLVVGASNDLLVAKSNDGLVVVVVGKLNLVVNLDSKGSDSFCTFSTKDCPEMKVSGFSIGLHRMFDSFSGSGMIKEFI